LHLILPGDISSAAFLIIAALIIPDSEIVLKDVLLNPTRTGLLDVLQAMGADLKVIARGERNGEPCGDIHVHSSPLRGVEVDRSLGVRMIDEFPVFAVAAAFARGKTVVSGAEELRHKESDRIAALCQELRLLGADIVETPDGFLVQGKAQLRGGEAQAHADHRLAMALAVAGLASQEGVIVHQAEWIEESFPTFVLTLQALGGRLWQVE
jgi:3-phosphoshikimate 1-carboxyvinyltransferase